MIAEHLAALKALIEAPNVRVFTEPPQSVGTLDKSAFPYVVLYLDSGARSTERQAPVAHRADFTAQTTIVALSEAQANAIRDNVVARLSLTPMSVAGRVCSRVQHIGGPGFPIRDDDVPDRLIFTAFDRWSFVSTAA